MKKYLNLIRVKHWLKNSIIFVPLFFSLQFLNYDLLFACIMGFLIFSFASSVVYVINDLIDIEKDRSHPVKKKRPLASGEITKKQAFITLGILIVIMFILMYLMFRHEHNIWIFILPILYIVINILYSYKLKLVPIVDVAVIMFGFVLRIMYGGLITGVEVSKYLYLMVIFGSFYLGFGKRRNEIIKNGSKSRRALKMYNQNFLDKNMYVSLALALVAYILWCVDITTTQRIGNDYIFWTIPLLFIIFQLYSLDIEKDSHGDPMEVILADKKLLAMIVIYVIIMGGVLYLPK